MFGRLRVKSPARLFIFDQEVPDATFDADPCQFPPHAAAASRRLPVSMQPGAPGAEALVRVALLDAPDAVRTLAQAPLDVLAVETLPQPYAIVRAGEHGLGWLERPAATRWRCWNPAQPRQLSAGGLDRRAGRLGATGRGALPARRRRPRRAPAGAGPAADAGQRDQRGWTSRCAGSSASRCACPTASRRCRRCSRSSASSPKAGCWPTPTS